MLTEHFVASVGAPKHGQTSNTQKDAAIFIHEFQPLQQQRSVFKKSAAAPNSLAISDSHIFAAQVDKAVVHVYSREKGNQEATVPFPERITCLTLACDDSVLVLGTAEGRMFLWEMTSGRQITTAQAHLQAITVVAMDPTGNFLLSASADSTVHTWSLPTLLSFGTVDVQAVSPLSTFTSHRAEVVSLVLGHSHGFSNFAISASKDKTCLVWNYHTGAAIRTYLLPEVPTCLALDAADRYAYVGYQDGSLHQVDFFNVRSEKEAEAPVQPPRSSRWRTSDASIGAAECLDISFDGCTILTGHQNGMITAWDSARGGFKSFMLQNPLAGSVTNLSFLPVTGFAAGDRIKIKIPAVVKPKIGAFDNANGDVPANWSLNVEFPSDLRTESLSDFQRALTAPSFPEEMLDTGLVELATWGKQSNHAAEQDEAEDYMALDDDGDRPQKLTLEEQNAQLKQELEALRRVQKASFGKMEKMALERKAMLKRQDRHASFNGASNGMSDTSDDD